MVSRKPEACDEVVAGVRTEGEGDAVAPAMSVTGRTRRRSSRTSTATSDGSTSSSTTPASRPSTSKLARSPRTCSTRSSRSTSRGRFGSPHWSASGWSRPAAARSSTSPAPGPSPTRDIVPYAAAKAGVNAMTVGLAHAFGPDVRVNASSRAVPHDDLAGLGHGGVRRARQNVPGCGAPATPTRSPERRCTSPATPRGTRRGRS